MKTILVPTDYSAASSKALVYALGMAKSMKLDVVVLHAFHQPISVEKAFEVGKTILSLEKEKEVFLERWANDVKNNLFNDFYWQFTSTLGLDPEEQTNFTRTKSGFHTIETTPEPVNEPKLTCICKFGLADTEINKVVNANNIDLVVMSSKGAGNFRQAFLGSTAAEVISSCQVPVLILPSQGEFKKLKTFTLAANLNTFIDQFTLQSLLPILHDFKADLQVLHLYKDKEKPLEQDTVAKGLEMLDLCFFDINYRVYFKRSDDVIAGIHEFVEQKKTDLLVLAPGKHTFMDILLNSSTTEKILEQGFVPFMTLPATSTLDFAETKMKKVKESAG